MKRLIVFFTILLIAVSAQASYIQYLNRSALPQQPELIAAIERILQFEDYVKEFPVPWKYVEPPDTVKNILLRSYKLFSRALDKDKKNIELNLLCGLIGLYLYNMDLVDYNDDTEKHFNTAHKLNPNDYRAQWFLAKHYINSAQLDKGIALYRAIMATGKDVNAPFLEDYAIGAYTAFMPRTSLWGLDRYKEVSGKKGVIDDIVRTKFEKSIKIFEPDKPLEPQNFWRVYPDESDGKIVNFPFGIKFTVLKSWGLQPGGYSPKSRGSGFIIKLPPVQGWNGQSMIPNIVIIIQIPDTSETPQKFIRRFDMAGYQYKEINLGLKKNEYAIQGVKKDGYPGQGEGRIISILFESNVPSNLSPELEEPISKYVLSNNVMRESFLKMVSEDLYKRIEGKLYYVITLDCSESIYDSSFKMFKQFLNTVIIR